MCASLKRWQKLQSFFELKREKKSWIFLNFKKTLPQANLLRWNLKSPLPRESVLVAVFALWLIVKAGR